MCKEIPYTDDRKLAYDKNRFKDFMDDFWIFQMKMSLNWKISFLTFNIGNFQLTLSRFSTFENDILFVFA